MIISDETVLQVLLETKRILTEETWTKGVLARNSYMGLCDPTDTGAKYFCIAGAVDRAIYNLRLTNFALVRQKTNEVLKRTSGVQILLGQWNDSLLNFDPVVRMLDTAIGSLR